MVHLYISSSSSSSSSLSVPVTLKTRFFLFFNCISHTFLRFIIIIFLQLLLGFQIFRWIWSWWSLVCPSIFSWNSWRRSVSNLGEHVFKLSDGYRRSTCLLPPIQPFCCQMGYLFLAFMTVPCHLLPHHLYCSNRMSAVWNRHVSKTSSTIDPKINMNVSNIFGGGLNS